MHRPLRLTIDRSALQANWRWLAERAGVAAGAAVKADGYGLGAREATQALIEAGCRDFFVSTWAEAEELGPTPGAEIVVLHGVGADDVEAALQSRARPCLNTVEQVARWKEIAKDRLCDVMVDTGMNRLGLRHDNLEFTLPELIASRNLEIVAVYTHFATADDPDHPLFQVQRERFEQVLARLPELGITPRIRHAANSAATLRDSRVWYDLVRPGLMMYGVIPPPLASTIALKPVMSLRSRIVAVKGVRVDEIVGYGGRFTVPKPGRIAVVPAGYADGLDRRMAGTCSVLIRGTRAPIVGAVNMDMITIDVSDVNVETGDEVVIIGAQGDDRIEVREIAAAVGTNPYEILCRVGTRIERIY